MALRTSKCVSTKQEETQISDEEIERVKNLRQFNQICSYICNSCDVGQNFLDFHSGLPEYIQIIMIVEKLYLMASSGTAAGLTWYEYKANKLDLSDEEGKLYPVQDKITVTKATIDGMLNQIKDFALKSEDIRLENNKLKEELKAFKGNTR